MNKVETKVDARFDLERADFLPDWVKANLRAQQRNRFNSQGLLVVSASEERTQLDNIRIVVEKLQVMINQASVIPKPPDKEKKQQMDQRKKAADNKRVEDKRYQSMKKAMKKGGY